MKKEEMIMQMNEAGRSETPFLFLIDFLGEDSIFVPLKQPSNQIYFSTPFFQHIPTKKVNNRPFSFSKYPISFDIYKKSFDQVQLAIKRGDSFLVNLTFPTPIETDLSLEEIFMRSKAPYRILVPDKFVCFSPESFVKIVGNNIYSFPMKGTIDASIPNAEELILNNDKEKAEHYTIVDLIRNDLGRIAEQVEVKQFRYLERIETNSKSLLQVSSEIVGVLPDDYRENLGSLIYSMLPAGSISGAPKDSTINIIKRTEIDRRGFYTGIFGIFDGKDLDSAVIIRYIEERDNRKYFRSGGGITARSSAEDEYKELIDKVYVPFT